jgi:hypothetical protein
MNRLSRGAVTRSVLAGGVLLAALAVPLAAGPGAAAKGGGDFASIFTDGSLVGAGWAGCPTAVIWDADVSALSPKAAKFALQDLEWAIGTWAAAGGIAVQKGAEGQLSYDNSSATVAGVPGGRKLFVKFVKDDESDYLSGRVVGVATPTKVIASAPEITGGSAAFRTDYVEYASKTEARALLLHELGHAFGLGHSNDKKSVVYPIVGKTIKLSAGDIAGIRAFTKNCDPSLDPQRG